MAISSKLKQQCPGVSTQMYLNSLMDFRWYGTRTLAAAAAAVAVAVAVRVGQHSHLLRAARPVVANAIVRLADVELTGGISLKCVRFDRARYDLHKGFEGANASQLLHDINGVPVTVNQDGGAGPQPVWDWGQAATKTKYMAVVDRALASGIDSFFLDKASTATRNDTQLCNHVCANLSEAVGTAWDAGHLDVLRTIQAKSPGPTVGNTGFGTCAKMGGCVQEKQLQASQQGIEQLASALAQNGTKAVSCRSHAPSS